ncbi:hypothetical protein PAXRUDRAFT_823632 [Paxillus rubicundulus Ve08.2h10]|uniref:Uncharacterized protein n=1 Tax=Paxillus rubicundulus Ve08.2h10 TaxID=930991 RepID=A0A0D0DVB6_9AGAM|nr:hypothetical protein PAXRUDRAFT_823632 [Paxillus rubicundulus Ve08.2h10]
MYPVVPTISLYRLVSQTFRLHCKASPVIDLDVCSQKVPVHGFNMDSCGIILPLVDTRHDMKLIALRSSKGSRMLSRPWQPPPLYNLVLIGTTGVPSFISHLEGRHSWGSAGLTRS